MGLIYVAGVVSGSLASFLLDPGLNLVGGSSGCYALLGAATASLVLNWHEDHAIVIRCHVSHVCSRVTCVLSCNVYSPGGCAPAAPPPCSTASWCAC